MAVERLESKAENIQTQLQENKNNLEQTFYEQLARNFGFKTNADAFEMLAKSLPINYLFYICNLQIIKYLRVINVLY